MFEVIRGLTSGFNKFIIDTGDKQIPVLPLLTKTIHLYDLYIFPQ